MSKSTDVRVKSVQTRAERYTYRTPIKFGGRVVVDAVVFDVVVDVETRDGRRGQGVGSMPIANAWAWPSQTVGGEQALAAMLAFAERLPMQAAAVDVVGHPLEISHAWAPLYAPLAAQIADEMHLAEPPPVLAQLVAGSPLEAAIHDAYGKTLGASAYNLLGPDYVNADLSHYLSAEFAGEYLDRYTLRTPKGSMPLYHLVGAIDPLTATDVQQPVGDGLPETLSEWIPYNGLTHLKIKLAGDDLPWDVERVVAVDRTAEAAQSARGCSAWFYSLDFNEKCASVDYVLDFLRRLSERAPRGLERVQYIEQPTHRDLHRFPENRMHAAAQIKPVVIDESLTDFRSLLLARELGYSGVALKACKGQSEALLMGAAAQKYGLFLCVQDLTCVGRSFLHSASLAARLPTIAAIEGNGRQYCPAGNAGWDQRFPGMFTIRDGSVGTAELTGPGLWG
ncbi:MAG: mandelate racemase/muconate lactonizing enzyme family protein [Pirellulales bacterium]